MRRRPVVVLLAVVVCGTCHAEETGNGSAPLVRLLRDGLRDLDLSVGYASNLQIPPSPDRSKVRFLTVTPRYGWFRGPRDEVLLEVPVILSTQRARAPTRTRSGVGVNGIFRHHFSKRRNFAPFVELGAGILATNIKVKELGGEFQFTPQGGFGVRLPSGGDADIIVALRFHHISNAGLRHPNVGLNSLLLMVGFSRTF